MATRPPATVHEAITRYSSGQLADLATALIDAGALTPSQRRAHAHGPGASQPHDLIPRPGTHAYLLHVPAGTGDQVAALVARHGCQLEVTSRVDAVVAPTDRSRRRSFRLGLRCTDWPASDVLGVVADLMLTWDRELTAAARDPHARLTFPTRLRTPTSLDDFCTHALIARENWMTRDAIAADMRDLAGQVHARFTDGPFATRPAVTDAGTTLAVLLADQVTTDDGHVRVTATGTSMHLPLSHSLTTVVAEALARPELLQTARALERPDPIRIATSTRPAPEAGLAP